MFTVSCLPKKHQHTQTNSLNSPEVFKKGFLKIGEDLHEIEYVTDGDEAIFDEHVRVPLNQIHTSPPEGLNLTIEKHVRLWPEGIVPYKKTQHSTHLLLNLPLENSQERASN